MKKNKTKKKFEFFHADNVFAGQAAKNQRFKRNLNPQELKKNPERKSHGIE
ncbi:hypothetical protein [Cyclobacterium plantarum]|uniref:Uncharacterized protein n=1 Tax=Cyclobacterium plantarum TaxID=2716263 RepID=A0ABX0H8H8_9BACT|nr:hypothetical protein [Cyclobacterium plantarum]NHE57685.1 hypothetical protein [Cyclobacterium plantarum]